MTPHDFSMKYRILVIDDDPSQARLVEALLRESPGSGDLFEFLSAHTLEEGLETVRKSRADAVFLDLHLPDSNEADALEAIRRLVPTMPILLLSGDARDKLTELAKNCVGVEVMCKSSIVEELTQDFLIRLIGSKERIGL